MTTINSEWEIEKLFENLDKDNIPEIVILNNSKELCGNLIVSMADSLNSKGRYSLRGTRYSWQTGADKILSDRFTTHTDKYFMEMSHYEHGYDFSIKTEEPHTTYITYKDPASNKHRRKSLKVDFGKDIITFPFKLIYENMKAHIEAKVSAKAEAKVTVFQNQLLIPWLVDQIFNETTIPKSLITCSETNIVIKNYCRRAHRNVLIIYPSGKTTVDEFEDKKWSFRTPKDRVDGLMTKTLLMVLKDLSNQFKV